MLKHEADALRREVNEWRDRAGLPRVEEPIRGDAFSMVITGELEAIQGIAIEEEDEESEDGYSAGLPMAVMPSVPHHPQQQVQVYNNQVYMDEVDEEAAMLGAMYAQQQNGPIHLTSQHQIQHSIMAPQPQELEDPRMAAMLLKNSNSFVHNAQPTGYPTVNTRSSPGSRSPTYELHHGSMQDFGGVPRMGGMGGGASFVPSHHHMRGQMQVQPQAVSVGGGVNALMMMMM